MLSSLHWGRDMAVSQANSLPSSFPWAAQGTARVAVNFATNSMSRGTSCQKSDPLASNWLPFQLNGNPKDEQSLPGTINDAMCTSDSYAKDHFNRRQYMIAIVDPFKEHCDDYCFWLATLKL
jgi:hypothetical protein